MFLTYSLAGNFAETEQLCLMTLGLQGKHLLLSSTVQQRYAQNKQLDCVLSTLNGLLCGSCKIPNDSSSIDALDLIFFKAVLLILLILPCPTIIYGHEPLLVHKQDTSVMRMLLCHAGRSVCLQS